MDSAFIPIIVSLITFLGVFYNTKVTLEEFNNRKNATPPELLRLEKWSTILKETEQYSEKTKKITWI